MLEDTLFWLGFTGLIAGIGVGISLLEDEGDAFLRNVMFSAGYCSCDVYILDPVGRKNILQVPCYLGFLFLSAALPYSLSPLRQVETCVLHFLRADWQA